MALQSEITNISGVLSDLESSKSDQISIKNIAVNNLEGINSSISSQNDLLYQNLISESNLVSQIILLNENYNTSNFELDEIRLLIIDTQSNISSIGSLLADQIIIRDDAISLMDSINSSIDAKSTELSEKQSQQNDLLSDKIEINNNINTTSDQLDYVRDLIAEVESNLSTINSQIQDNITIKNDAVSQADSLNSSIDSQTNILQDQLAQESSLVQNISLLNSTLIIKNDDLISVRDTISITEGSIVIINTQIQQNTTTRDNAINEANILNNSIATNNSLLDSKQAELDQLLSESNETIELILALQNDIIFIEGVIADLVSNLTGQIAIRDDAITMIDTINSSLAVQNDLLDNKTLLADNLISEIDTINQSISSKVSELDQVTQQISDIEGIIADVDVQLLEQNNIKENASDELQIINSSLVIQNDLLTDKNQIADSLVTEISLINQNIDSKNIEFYDAKQQVTDIQNIISNIEFNIVSLNDERDNKIISLGIIQTELQDKQNELQIQNDELAQLEQDVFEIKTDLMNPYSGKVTITIQNNLKVEKKVWDKTEWSNETTILVNEYTRFNLSIMNIGEVPLIDLTIIDILPMHILEYADNATPYEPFGLDSVYVWELEELEPGINLYIEFDALGIAEGFGNNDLFVKAYVNLTDLNPLDAAYKLPDYHIIEDKDFATVYVDGILNNPPEANDDFVTFDEDTIENTIDVLANDSDPDAGDTITLGSIESGPTNGTAEIADDSIQYTPNADFAGSDSFIYRIHDNYGASDTAEVFITVTNINDAPVAVDDEYSINENTPTDFDVVGNDYDIDEDELTLDSIENGPSNGTASIVSGKIRYEPNNGFIGSDSIGYKIIDGNGGNDTAIVTIIVNNVNDPP